MTDPQQSSAEHKPFIPASTVIRELTPLPLFVGTILGILFGTASLYLVLKVGLTISASIPIAVMSISIFRWFSKVFGTRPATILQNNITQTVGSAGESIAFGVGVTMPALLILGQDLELSRIMTVAVLGGLLGILMMIPLRRGMVVKEHGKLIFPEGTACAEVLIAGEKGGMSAKTVFSGFGLGFLYRILNHESGLKLIKQTPERDLSFFKGASVGAEMTPELFGVGFIIGPRIASIMCAGGVLAYLVLIPAIKMFGEGLAQPLFPATTLIKDMGPGEIRSNYILYIGAGAVAAGGIISLIRVIPTLLAGLVHGMKDFSAGQAGRSNERTDHDLPMIFVVLGGLVLVSALKLIPAMNIPILGAILVVLFGFLFVTVSSRLTGEIGSSSNPISGMTVATLLLTCLIFLWFGWTSPTERVAALMIAGVVCIASSNGGTTAQDLKTGFLVGATPRNQQIGILVGALTSALVIGVFLRVFNDSATIFAKQEFSYTVPREKLGANQRLHGPEAEMDKAVYHAVHFTEESAPRAAVGGAYLVPPGKYLADDTGKIHYLVDPGINGTLKHRDPTPANPVGQKVEKFDAPKARLMSLIIDGILTHKLPWGLVLLGVFIAITLEMSSISALPFAVGVYLPLSASAPIWIGGMVRWVLDKTSGPKSATQSDSSPGVLFSSGLIAGGAIAGMLVALFAGFAAPSLMDKLDLSKLTLFKGFAESDLVATLIFLGLGGVVYLVGREKLLAGKK